jgi:hypothetical protein
LICNFTIADNSFAISFSFTLFILFRRSNVSPIDRPFFIVGFVKAPFGI